MAYLLLVLMLIASPAAAAPVTIGGTVFPLGEAAFPTGSTCLTPPCGGEVPLQDANRNPVPPEAALLGHDLSLVVFDMDDTDEFRLTFSQPIVNLPGDDLYLAQADFITGGVDIEDGIHDMQVRFDNSATWHTLGSAAEFGQDPLAGAPIVNFADPEPKSAGYSLWFTKQDLSDFGYAPGESISGLELRGPAGGGLDAVMAGNLSIPEPGSCAMLGAGILGLTIARSRRRGAA